MAITLSQNPGTINQAYGVNAVSLNGIVAEDKYVVRIKNQAGDVVADVRQTPNKYGQAIFDIQNILQTYVKPGDADIDSIGVNTQVQYRNSFNLGFLYDIEYGTETDGIFTATDTLENLEVYPGRKEYYEINWPITKYSSEITTTGSTIVVEEIGEGLTDNLTTNEYLIILDANTVRVNAYEHTVRPDDRVTVSYLQNVIRIGDKNLSSTGISAFTIIAYDTSNTLLFENTYQNVLSAGGGPYTTLGESITPAYPYNYITFGAGPANLDDLDFSQAAYYYVIPRLFDGNTSTGLNPDPNFYGHKFTIDRGICLDFEPIQFSWMNSLGVRDYYTFTKKNEKSVKIKRDTYLKSAVDYNGVTYQVNAEERGTTTYSQQLTQEFITNTDYISDLDAEWLESLFVSPDVRVRFSGETQWFPVTLTSNSYTQKTFKKDRLFQYEVRFKLAHNIKSQRG